MLFLLFDVGEERYAVEVAQVEQVLPMLELRALPQAPAGVAGLCNFAGSPVPVIDLAQLMTGRAAALLLSTRLILARYAAPDGTLRRLGLIAERVTETLRRDHDDFDVTGFRQDETPYLGPVTAVGERLVQWVQVQSLLPESVQERLFALQTPTLPQSGSRDDTTGL